MKSNITKFESWWENHGYFSLKNNTMDEVELSRASWNAAKKEILYLIDQKYLGANTNFKLKDIEKLYNEIKNL